MWTGVLNWMEMQWEPTDLDSVQIKEEILILHNWTVGRNTFKSERVCSLVFLYKAANSELSSVIRMIACFKVVWLALAGMERCLWHRICEKQTVMSHCGGQRDRLAKITQSSSSSGLRHAIVFSQNLSRYSVTSIWWQIVRQYCLNLD